MALRTPNLLMSLGFCQLYKASNSKPPGFSINSSKTKLIFKRLKQKRQNLTKGSEFGSRASWRSWLKSVVKLYTSRVLTMRMLLAVKLLKKLLVEEEKLCLGKRKSKKTPTRTSSKSGRNHSQRGLLVRSQLRKSLARSKWWRRLAEILIRFLLLEKASRWQKSLHL